jgi:cyclophilin family peptidyl-prolyl cis-trans isomerase
MIAVRGAALSLAVTWLVVGCLPEQGGGREDAENAPGTATDSRDLTPTVVLETSKGTMVLELDAAKAPGTVANLVAHVKAGFYDGLTFHRVMRNFMIQTGRLTPDMKRRSSQVQPLRSEADNGLKNVRGAVAMARTTDPHSAQTEFFINTVDNPDLDYTEPTPEGWGYTVFGRVVEGLDVVDAIAAVRTGRRGRFDDIPVEPVVVERAYVREEDGRAVGR